jgi:hypothetical protein
MDCFTPVLLIPVGAVLYLAVNYAVFGDPFQFLIFQREHWNQEFSFFFDNMRTLASNALYFDTQTASARFIPELIFVVLFVGLMIFGAVRRFRLSMFAYLGAYFLLTVSASWLLSFERYTFGAMPVFPLLACADGKSRVWAALIKLICVFGLMYLMIAYVNGKHVY